MEYRDLFKEAEKVADNVLDKSMIVVGLGMLSTFLYLSLKDD